MQHTINKHQGKWDYDGVNNEWKGNDGNDYSTTQYLFRRLLNLKDVKTVMKNSKDTPQAFLKEMNRRFNSGYDIIISADVDMFLTLDEEQEVNNGSHAVTYLGGFKDLGIGLGNERWFSFNVQTWGETKPHPVLINENMFLNMFNNYTQGIKKNGNNKTTSSNSNDDDSYKEVSRSPRYF